MTPVQAMVLAAAGAAGGAVNSVAGGGSFISFPTLLIYGHVPPIEANATNTVALWPGAVASAAAYRSEFSAHPRMLVMLSLVSVVGGIGGAALLLKTPQSTFLHLLPWLMLCATLLFTYGGAITKRLRKHTAHVKAPSWAGTAGVLALQLVIAIYGGYFGGGIGILMLAALALMGMEQIHTMNALKTLLASIINGVAVVVFIAAGRVFWPQAGVMVLGAVLGGYAGARYAVRLPQSRVRAVVIAVGCGMTAYFFYRYGLG